METAMKLDENFAAPMTETKEEVVAPKVDDFEKMILEAASSATKKITSKKDAVVDGIDISSVAAAITGKKKDTAKIKALAEKADGAVKVVKEKKEKVKREKKSPDEKGLPIGNRDSKYGDPVLRLAQPEFGNGMVVADDKYIIQTNVMANIKGHIKDIVKMTGCKKVSIYMNCATFFTQYHKMVATAIVPVTTVGKTFLTVQFDGKPWLINPSLQDETFSLVVSAVSEK